MIYYPLSTLMLAGVRQILVITTPHESGQFQRLLGDGSQWGIELQYAVQPTPDGLAQALIIGEEFVSGEPVALILGDNIFFGPGMGTSLDRMKHRPGATIFSYPVENPRDFGVVEFDSSGRVTSLEEKPKVSKSNFAVPGLYFYDEHGPEMARDLKPSPRGELEITDLHKRYLEQGKLQVEALSPNITWLDSGSVDSLHKAATIIFEIERDIGRKINVPEEIAWRMGFISYEELQIQARKYPKSGYGSYLNNLTA
jgi:glucose-1-phosphate thymidylyltransferase